LSATKLTITTPTDPQKLYTAFNVTVTAKDVDDNVIAVEQDTTVKVIVQVGNQMVFSGGEAIIVAGASSVSVALQLGGSIGTCVLTTTNTGGLENGFCNAFQAIAGPPFTFKATSFPERIMCSVTYPITVTLLDRGSNTAMATGSLTAGISGIGIIAVTSVIGIGASQTILNVVANLQWPTHTALFSVTGLSGINSNPFEIVPGPPVALELESNSLNPLPTRVRLKDTYGQPAWATTNTVVKFVRTDTGTQNGMGGILQGTILAGQHSVALFPINTGAANLTIKAIRVSGDSVTETIGMFLLTASGYLSGALLMPRIDLGMDPTERLFGRAPNINGHVDFYQGCLEMQYLLSTRGVGGVGYNTNAANIPEFALMQKRFDTTAKTMYPQYEYNTYLKTELLQTSQTGFGAAVSGRKCHLRVYMASTGLGSNPFNEVAAPFDVPFRVIAHNRTNGATWYSTADLIAEGVITGTLPKGSRGVIVEFTPTLPSGLTQANLYLAVAQETCFRTVAYTHTGGTPVGYFTDTTENAFRTLESYVTNITKCAIAYESKSGTAGYLINSALAFALDSFFDSANKKAFIATGYTPFSGSVSGVKVAFGVGTGFFETTIAPCWENGLSMAGTNFQVVAEPGETRVITGYISLPEVARCNEEDSYTAALKTYSNAPPAPAVTGMFNGPAGSTLRSGYIGDVLANSETKSAAGVSTVTFTHVKPGGTPIEKNLFLTPFPGYGSMLAPVPLSPQRFTGISNLVFTAATKRLTSATPVFAAFTGATDYLCRITAGTGITLGRYAIAAKRSDYELELVEQISLIDVTDNSIAVILEAPPFYGLRFTAFPAAEYYRPRDFFDVTVELFDLATGLAYPAPQNLTINLEVTQGAATLLTSGVRLVTGATQIMAAGNSTVSFHTAFDRASFTAVERIGTAWLGVGNHRSVLSMRTGLNLRASVSGVDTGYRAGFTNAYVTPLHCLNYLPSDPEILEKSVSDRAFFYVEEDQNNPQGERIRAFVNGYGIYHGPNNDKPYRNIKVTLANLPAAFSEIEGIHYIHWGYAKAIVGSSGFKYNLQCNGTGCFIQKYDVRYQYPDARVFYTVPASAIVAA
jgi:hypothetical protein